MRTICNEWRKCIIEECERLHHRVINQYHKVVKRWRIRSRVSLRQSFRIVTVELLTKKRYGAC